MELQTIRAEMGRAFADPELLLRRMKVDRGVDTVLEGAGHRLREAAQASMGRGLMIETGLITADPQRLEFERVLPVEGLALMPIGPKHTR